MPSDETPRPRTRKYTVTTKRQRAIRRARLLNLLYRHPGAAGSRLAAALGISQPQASLALQALHNEGTIAALPGDRYCMPSDVPSARKPRKRHMKDSTRREYLLSWLKSQNVCPTIQEMAAVVGRTPETVFEDMKRLEKAGLVWADPMCGNSRQWVPTVKMP